MVYDWEARVASEEFNVYRNHWCLKCLKGKLFEFSPAHRIFKVNSPCTKKQELYRKWRVAVAQAIQNASKQDNKNGE